jgi:hypothetical protein
MAPARRRNQNLPGHLPDPHQRNPARARRGTHRGKGTGAELTARVTAMHKYSAQTKKEPLAAADATLMAEAAQVEAAVKETPTPAERVVDVLREERSQDVTLTPEQKRAEDVAATARKVRQNLDARRGAPTQEHAPEAVDEALKDIAARRQEESTTGEAASGEAQKSWQEKLAAAQQKQPATGNDFTEKLARIRKGQEDQAAEEARRKAARRGPSAEPEQGRRGPSL